MPNTVRETFDQLRQYLKGDINQLLAQAEGGNYAVALLVAIGSEALSGLQGFRDDTVFVDLMTKHGLTPEIASDVFEALRHGIAHVYDTRYIQSGKLKIELIVSWGRREHLTVRRDPPGLYLNVRTMWDDLREVIATLKATLPPGGELPAAWVHDSINPGDPRAAAAWATWITTHEEG